MKLPTEEVVRRIKAGAARRRDAKRGVVKRYVGQAKVALACLCAEVFIAASAVRNITSRPGPARIDIMEVGSRDGEVSMCAVSQCWNVMQPIECGDAIRSNIEDNEILIMALSRWKPRLVVVGPGLTDGYRHGYRHAARELQDRANLVEAIVGSQVERGDHVVIEVPKSSPILATRSGRRLQANPALTTVKLDIVHKRSHESSGIVVDYWVSADPFEATLKSSAQRWCEHGPSAGKRKAWRGLGAKAIVAGFAKHAVAQYPWRVRQVCYQWAKENPASQSLQQVRRWLGERHEALEPAWPGGDEEEVEEVFLGDTDSHLHPDGIRFDMTAGELREYPAGMLAALRRMHVNCGHPPNADLERVVRSAGGLPLAAKACKHLQCSTCQKLSRPKPQRPSRIPQSGLQFNERVQIDACQVFDARGQSWWLLVTIDVATDFTNIQVIRHHSSEHFWRALEKGWLTWAGPPDAVVADGERGLALEWFITRLV